LAGRHAADLGRSENIKKREKEKDAQLTPES
jgi:hypothetical protein